MQNPGVTAEFRALVEDARTLLTWCDDLGCEGLDAPWFSGGALATQATAREGQGGGRESGTRQVPPGAAQPSQMAQAGITAFRSAVSGDPAPSDRPAAAARRVAPTAVGDDERRTRLALLAEEARTCKACRLHEARTQAVFARGNPMSELCFVGEGPGADEDAQGEPFVGKAGQLLDKMITAMGYRRDDVYICNIVKCRPPENRKPEPDEVSACVRLVDGQLGLIAPKAIVALGATALQGLTGSADGITRARGKWKLYKGAVPVMPTFHPAYLLRQPEAKREVWSDLKQVMKLLGKE